MRRSGLLALPALALLMLPALALGIRLPDMRSFLKPSSETDEGVVWALLIAGSAGWGNYRHQADVCHAYQVLARGGIKDDTIVVMMHDDLAHNEQNPRPGQVFNHPAGEDVYAGVPKDYTGPDVNAKNFLAVLAGDASALEIKGRSSRRVVKAGPSDRIFLYYSDHGAPGILGMPAGPFLYADQLHSTLAARAAAKGFGEMVIYIEACESGSMFQGLLEDDLGIYATTAANGAESSWGTYCPGMNPPPPQGFDTCLGDLYSVAWLEDSDCSDLTAESLKKQYQRVRLRTSQNWTYAQGSHVQRFGTLELDDRPVADYLGEENTGGFCALQPLPDGPGGNGIGEAWATLGAVPQRDADLLSLAARAASAAAGAARDAALAALRAEQASRARVDAAVAAAVVSLAEKPAAGPAPLLAALEAKASAWAAAGLGALPGVPAPHLAPAAPAQALAQLVLNEPLPRPAGAALVDDWGCLRGMVAAWEGACGPLDQYGMRHSRAFANLCNAGVAPRALGAAALRACAAPGAAAA